MTEAQRRAYMIADNKLADLAGYDKSLLKFEFSEILGLDSCFDLTVTGFSMDEIDILFDDADPGAECDVEKAASGPPVTSVGDLWTLGKHRLLCADARDQASYHRLLGSHRAQMVFTDPPYNVAIAGNVSGLGKVRHGEFIMASGEMSRAEFTEFLTSVLKQLASVSIDGSIHYVCMDWRHMHELGIAGEAAYSELKNLVVWDKGCGGMGSFYRNQHELIFVFKKGTGKHINNFALGQHGRYRTNIWSCPGANSFKAGRQDELAMHPTVKPVELIVEAMRDCSKKNGIVLDAFGGSGSTLIAAEHAGRRARLVELDPKYVDVTIRRWQQLTGLEVIDQEGRSFDERAHGSQRIAPRKAA